jgi:eukaryotic-like serine/threonine-protein kinase
MTPRRCAEVLALAERMGIARPEDGAGDPATRLAALVAAGLLSPRTVADLERELGPPAGDELTFPEGFRYRPLRELGAGGMGRVLLAEDRVLGRRVALKLLHRERVAAARRVITEARVQARVDHPHVCKVYEVGEVGGRHYLALQLIEGPTLAEAGPRLDVATRLRLLCGVAEGVHAAHERGLIHRDLKPANILVEGDHAYVTDFGVALDLKAEGRLDRDRAGTPAFMAPEQSRDDATLDRRTDVFGLGATIYAVFTGRPPARPAHLGDLPPRLAAIVARCLEEDPARRYPSARHVARALRRLITPRRRVRLAGLGLTGALLLGALALVMGGGAGGRAAEQRFGQEAARLEALARAAHTLPLHDVRAEHAGIRDRLARLAEELPAQRGQARALVLQALGQGALALGELETARAHLEAAVALGARSAAVTRALGQTRVAARLAALRRGEQRVGDARGLDVDDPLVAAQRLFLEERWEDAAAAGLALFAAEPALYEAAALAGAAYLAQALGGEPEALAPAGAAFAAALAVGRSDPALLELECARATLAGDSVEPCRRAALALGRGAR